MKILLRAALPVIFLLVLTTSTKAQDVLDNLAAKTCECIKDIDTSADKNALKLKLGLCMIREAMPYKKEIKKKYNIDLDNINAGAGQQLGSLLGVKMVTVCPDNFSKLIPAFRDELGDEEDEDGEDVQLAEIRESTEAKTMMLEGNITDIKGTEFATVILKDANNREQKLLWLDYFANAELLTGNLDALKATKIKVWYTEREIYNVQLKDYIKYKVITRIELKQ